MTTCRAVSHCLAMKDTFFARVRGRMPVAYPGATRSSSFSANGAIRHMVRGSAMQRSCELTSSGNRFLSLAGLLAAR